VTRSLWEYSQQRHIADDYDAYFAYNTLFEFDLALLERHFATPGRLVDLGCGTGRLLLPFAQRGYPTLAVDLSLPMLNVVGEKAAAAGVHIDRLQANMVELGCLADGCADYCIIMFSTLGMVRGHANRLAALRHARRILKPGGLFVCHVHNRWYNLFDPQGRRWLLANAWQRLRGQSEFGDKVVDYRGIPNMFLHVFTRTEFTALLAEAGFKLKELTLLDTARRHALPYPWFLGRLRANGWIAVCERG
jgi:SAM-dependent methyltransferase